MHPGLEEFHLRTRLTRLLQRDLVLSKKSYNRVFDRLQKEVVRGETIHLIVLLGVPIAYPRLVWLENL